MAIYYAYIDRAPVFIIGATGPMDEAKRRPHIDWTHTAFVQGNAVRDYVKWDYQPTSIQGVPESFARAYSIMMTEPQGPIYMCYDAALQEAPLDRHRWRCRRLMRSRRPRPSRPTRRRSRRSPTGCCGRASDAARRICRPAAGRLRDMVELAETVGAAVWDVNNALNFPNKHPLCLSMDKESFKHTDLIVGLDCKDWEKQLTELNTAKRTLEPSSPAILRLRRDRLCRNRHQQMGDGLLPHAAMLGARARRHRARHPGADRLCKAAHRRRRRAAERGSPSARPRSASATTRVGEMAGGGAEELGRLADHVLAAGAGSVGRDQERGLGAHRQQPQASGAQAVGFRQALPPSRRRAWHRHPDRHLARRRARPQGQGPRWWSTSSPTAT